MVEHPDPIWSEYSDITFHMTVAGKIKGSVEKPDIVRILQVFEMDDTFIFRLPIS